MKGLNLNEIFKMISSLLFFWFLYWVLMFLFLVSFSYCIGENGDKFS